jgi:hypothetical protein
LWLLMQLMVDADDCLLMVALLLMVAADDFC